MRTIQFREAVCEAMSEEMRRDDRVFLLGEEVAEYNGAYKASKGMLDEFGPERVIDTPISELGFSAIAVGAAMNGLRPIVEFMTWNFAVLASDQIINHASKMLQMSGGQFGCPIVFRGPNGQAGQLAATHSQAYESLYASMPGLKVVTPFTPYDAKGLLKSAIRGEDPVLFLEHKALYRQGPARRPEPHADYLVPLGKAAVARPGTDLTIVTWGAIVYKALNVAKALEKEGVSVEVIDLRSILPLDTEAILRSVKKTGRALVAYEDHEFMGFGAEVAAQVSDAAFGYLDAPVKRVAGAFSSIPYADVLEKEVRPQDDDVLAGARAVLGY